MIATKPIRPIPQRTKRRSSDEANGDQERLDQYLTFRSELTDLQQSSKLSKENRRVIAQYFNGELIQSDTWKARFPSGIFQCLLHETEGPLCGECVSRERVFFEIDFSKNRCSKIIRRIAFKDGDGTRPQPSHSANERAGDSFNVFPSNVRIDDVCADLDGKKQMLSDLAQLSDVAAIFGRPSGPKAASKAAPADTAVSEIPGINLKVASPVVSPTIVAPRKRQSTGSSPDPRKRRASETNVVAPKSPAPKKRRKSSPKKRISSASIKANSGRDDAASFEVERILDMKRATSRPFGRLFLVKWAGRQPNGKPWEDTWEPDRNVSDDLIEEFTRSQKSSRTR